MLKGVLVGGIQETCFDKTSFRKLITSKELMVARRNRLFSLLILYVFLISDHVRVRQRTVSFKCPPCTCIHVHMYSLFIKRQREIPWRTSRGLIWENKTYYKLKRSIVKFLLCVSVCVRY